MPRSLIARVVFALSLALVPAVTLPARSGAQQQYPRQPQCGKGPAAWFTGSASFPPGQDTLAAVLRIVAAGAVQSPQGIFVLADDSTGAPPRAALVGSNLPDSVQPRLRQVAAAYLRSHPAKPGARTFFFVDLGASGDMLPEHQEVAYCRPHIRNIQTVLDYLQQAANHAASYQDIKAGRKGVTGNVAVLVDRNGNVVWADVRPSSGNRAVDDNYLAVALQMRFTPGTIDGERRAFLTLVPLMVEMW